MILPSRTQQKSITNPSLILGKYSYSLLPCCPRQSITRIIYVLEGRPGHGVSVAGLAREASLLEDSFCAGLECRELARAEIRLKVSEQAWAKSEAGKQIVRNLLPGEIPKHRPQFIFLMEADPMVYGEKFVCTVFKEYMPTLAVCVIAKHVEEDHRFEKLPVLFSEVEVMIFGIIFDKLLEGARAVGAIVAQHGKRDKMKTEAFTDKIRCHFTPGQCVIGKIPERLFALSGLVNGLDGCIPVMHINQKSVIGTKCELTFEFKVAMGKDLLKIVGSGYHVSSSLSA
jgi:hypothetical protein